MFQATDKAASKVLHITPEWAVAFAGNANSFKTLLLKLRDVAKSEGDNLSAGTMKKISSQTYSEVLLEQFTALNLYQLGYRTVEDFRKIGRTELGDEIFKEYVAKLEKFDPGLDIVVFGYDKKLTPHIFQVCNPGRVQDENVIGYSVIGSGYWMAMSLLKQRKSTIDDLETVIYRSLEAKFSSETAAGVGRTTVVSIMDHNGKFAHLGAGDINKIRNTWEKTRDDPIPDEARNSIAHSSAFKQMHLGES